MMNGKALTPGSRWKSAVCDTEIVIVRAPKEPGALDCGGVAMLAKTEERLAGAKAAIGLMTGSQLGKRYADDATGLEALCTKAGEGTLRFAGRQLTPREAKQLPSSD